MSRAFATRQSIPLLKPNPPKLSLLQPELLALEASGFFANNGQQVQSFQAEATQDLFGGIGDCTCVSSATMGLIMALKRAADAHGRPGGLALMPSFTFAATAHAAIWAGLTPVLCDIEPDSWIPSASAEETLLHQYGGRIAAIVPYASFGNGLDLDRYAYLSEKHGVAIVVDAASSLGSVDAQGLVFGAGSRLIFVYSMHATKAFAVGEGGLIYSADAGAIQAFRDMANFGFSEARSATMPGLNGKMSELTALLARAKLRDMAPMIAHRNVLASRYRELLPDAGFQTGSLRQQALQFMPVLLPAPLAPARAVIMASMAEHGIGTGAYFSPHLAQQPYFQTTCITGDLPVTENIASRILALPLWDTMTEAEVDIVCGALRAACSAVMKPIFVRSPWRQRASAVPLQAAVSAA